MKQIFLAIILIIAIVPFFPWWTFAIILSIFGWFSPICNSAKKTGFISGSTSWGIKLVIGYLNGGKILLNRVAEMLQVGNSIYLIFASIIFAGLLGYLSSLSGYHLRKVFQHTSFTT